MSNEFFQMNEFLEQLIKLKIEASQQKPQPTKDTENHKQLENEAQRNHKSKPEFKHRQKLISESQIAFSGENADKTEFIRNADLDSKQFQYKIERIVLEPIDFSNHLNDENDDINFSKNDEIFLVQISDDSLRKFLEVENLEIVNDENYDSFGVPLDRLNTKELLAKSALLKNNQLFVKLENQNTAKMILGTNELQMELFENSVISNDKLVALNSNENVYFEIGRIDNFYVSE